jgi:hypothetical protein
MSYEDKAMAMSKGYNLLEGVTNYVVIVIERNGYSLPITLHSGNTYRRCRAAAKES